MAFLQKKSSTIHDRRSGNETSVLALLSAQPLAFWLDLTEYHSGLQPFYNHQGPSSPDSPSSPFPPSPKTTRGMTAISAGTTAFDSAHASASTFLHTFLSSQTTYDISAQNLHRAFDALDDDRNGMCDTVELMRAMITQDFDFTNFPRCYVRLLGLTQNKLLSDVELDKFTNDPSLMNTWTITFPIFVHVVRSLKQHVLLNPHVYRKTFKLARLNRLKELSANVRFLRRKGGDKNRNSKSVRTKEVTVSPDDVTVSSRAPFNSLDDDAVPPAHFNIQNAPSSLRLVFSDINSANDEVETSTHAEIVAALHDLGVNVTVYDFRIDHLVKQGNVNATLQTLHPFLRAETRPENSKVRWINCESFDQLTLLQIVTAQSVHPLASKDILTLTSQPTKITEFINESEGDDGRGHFSVIFPVLRLSRRARIDLSKAKKLIKKRQELRQLSRLEDSGIVKEGASSGGWLKEHIRSCENSILSLTGGKHRTQELKLDVESSRVCVLLSGPPEYDTLMSFSTGWRGRKQTKEDNAVDSDSESDSENEDPPPNDGDLHDMDEDQIKSDLLGAFWRQDRYLQKDFSFIRSGDANWLLCSMLTSVVEDVTPIIFAYRLQLEIMQDKFHDDVALDDIFLKKVHECQREIEWVQRKVKPLKRIVRHMIDDKRIGNEISHYFEDVEDGISGCLEDLTSVVELIAVMKLEFESASDRKLNNMLGVLTFATVCILPLQTLTGLYGMNFVDVNGDPAMPELKWKWGYTCFWCFSICSMALIFVYFRFKLKVI